MTVKQVVLPRAHDFNIDCVGESNYTGALLIAAGAKRWDTSCEAQVMVRLIAEPENEYDSNAVAVVSQHGRKLAYLAREDAEQLQPIIAPLCAVGEVWAISEIGGSQPDDRWRIGIRLSLHNDVWNM